MKQSFVLDGSTTVSWCFEEVQTPYALTVSQAIRSGAEAHVPHIWPLEVTNALVKAMRRGRISRAEMFEYASQLASMKVRVDLDGSKVAFARVLALADRYQLSTYDAAYLELAERLRTPIATSDKNLVQAARAVGVELWG